MSAAIDEKYAEGYVFSQQAELDQLQDPANYMDEVEDAKKAQAQSIEYHQREAERPLEAHSRAAYQRRIRAKKAVREAKAATKNIKKMEAEIVQQVEARKTYLEAQKAEEKKVYMEAAKKKEEEIKFNLAKQEWLKSHKIADIPTGISLGYLSEGSMSWYNRLKALEAPYANRRTDLPSHERHKLEFLYKGGTEKEWEDSRARDLANQRMSQRQSASIKAGAAIEAAGGTLGGKYTAKSADGSLMGSDLRATSTDPKIAAANQAQSAYVAQLRAGGIGLAQALLKPQTEQSYLVKQNTGVANDFKEVTKDQTTINLETYLTERGYDISKPETIPDSIFKAPEKYVRARAQTKEPVMGDLRTLVPEAPQITQAEIAQRKAIQKKFAIPESPIYAQGSRTILTQEDGKGKISVMPIGEPRLISGDESKQAPHLTITKTETITKPDKYEPASQVLMAKEDSSLPPGFESGEAKPLFNYDKGLLGGFFGYTAEMYTSVSNLFRPEDQQRYSPPSLETVAVEEAISGAKNLLGWRDEEGNLPPLKTGQTQKFIQEKDIPFLIGTTGAALALGVATFGAQKVWPAIKGWMVSRQVPKYDKQVMDLSKKLYEPGVKVGVERTVVPGRYVVTGGTEIKPEKIPAWIIEAGKKQQATSFTVATTLNPAQQLTKLTVVGKKPPKTFAETKSVGKFGYEVPVQEGNVVKLQNPFTKKQSQIQVENVAGKKFRQVKDIGKKKKKEYTTPVENLIKTEQIKPTATMTTVPIKNLEQYPKMHVSSIENPKIIMKDVSLVADAKITKADRFRKKAVIRETPKTFEIRDPKVPGYRWGKKIVTVKKDVTTQKRGADIVNPETGEKITTSMNIPDTKLTSTLTDLTSMKSPQVLKTEKAATGSTESLKATAREMANQKPATFTMETGTAATTFGTAAATTIKAQPSTSLPQGTTATTLSAVPQTTTFTGGQTTTVTTGTTIPLSRNLIMQVPTIQRDKASVPLKDIAREIANVRERQKIKSATTPLSTSAIRQATSTIGEQTTKTNLRLTPGFRLSFKTTTKLALVPALKMTTTPPIRTPPRRPPVVPLPFIPTEIKTKKRERKTKRRKKRDFLGNVSERSILGVYKRSDIVYGKKKVARLSRKDARLQKSGKNKLQFLKESDVKSKAKRKPKTETILGKKWPKNVNLTKGRRAKRSPTRI